MDATEIVTVHEAELVSPRQVGGRLRAYCHLHGGNHQRSLSMALDGDAAGYGLCHQCGVKVFVPELAPDRAARGGPRSWRPRPVTAATLLRPARRPVASDPTPQDWQRDELATLAALDGRMRARLADDRPASYLAERAIPYAVAASAGVGYIPADAPAKVRGVDIGKWRDRLIFPLASPAGVGYAGRSLAGWRPGIDENVHKAMLDGDGNGPRRWEKTYPAGWLGFGDLASAEHAVIVEGPIDALALRAAAPSLDDVPVVALVGTAARSEWIPANVAGVVLALDGDAAGQKRAQALRDDLRAVGLSVAICAPAVEDGCGKDWSERWRLAEYAGVWPVFDALDTLAGAEDAVTPARVSSPVADTPTAPSASVDALARADGVVRFFMAHGLTLADVRELTPEEMEMDA